MPTIEADVTTVNLVLYQGADLTLDINWWADDAKTVPIDIAAIQCQVRQAGAVVLDLATYITGVGTNSLHLFIPAAVTAGLKSTDRAVWDLDATRDDNGEVRKLLRGSVTVKGEVSA